MKKLLFILFNLIFSICGYSQRIFSAPSITSADEVTTIDSTLICISYALNAENIKDINTYDDLQRLEIGSSLSRYYSWFLSNSDSLLTQHIKKSPKVGGIPRRMGPCGKKCNIWSEYRFSEFVKDFEKGTLTEYARMPMYLEKFNSTSTENLPQQQWNIMSDTLTVAGYLCQKATCDFRGRTFIAWFAPDIPTSNGPWKFGGLPGLILKVYDKDGLYIFECIKIENFKKKYPIKLLNAYSKYTRMTREKLFKYQKEIHEKYFQMMGMTSMDGRRFEEETTDYQGLELE